MYGACVVLLASTALAVDPTPKWPDSFFANFTETHLGPAKSNGTGWFALDLTYNGGKGAQAIFRSDGGNNRCGIFHKNTPCTELAVDGQRYFIFPVRRHHPSEWCLFTLSYPFSRR
jgi:hypothetical protein